MLAISASSADPWVASFSSAVSVPGQVFPSLSQRKPNRLRSAPPLAGSHDDSR
jgi:hypothetical protein